MKANKEVIEKWKKGEKATSRHLRTDGKELWSYGLRIGFTGEDGMKYVYNYKATDDRDWLGNVVRGIFKSVTTSRHVGLARRVAYATETPEVRERKELEARKSKEVARLRRKLREYCHLESCKNVYDCPRDCVETNCKERLGLDTAIAWKLADWLDVYVGKETEVVLRFAKGVLALHQQEYSKLSKLVEELTGWFIK